MEDTHRNFRMLELKSYRILTCISYTISISTLKTRHYKISIFTTAQDCKLHFNIILQNFKKKIKKVLQKKWYIVTMILNYILKHYLENKDCEGSTVWHEGQKAAKSTSTHFVFVLRKRWNNFYFYFVCY